MQKMHGTNWNGLSFTRGISGREREWRAAAKRPAVGRVFLIFSFFVFVYFFFETRVFNKCGNVIVIQRHENNIIYILF